MDRAAIEEKIRASVAAGDLEGAAVATLREYGRPILVYLGAVMRDEEASKEVFSQFTEDLWKGLPGFRGEASMWTWAHRVAWNAMRRYYRDPYKKRGRRLETAEVSKISDRVFSRSAIHLRSAAKSGLANLRDHLSADEQNLLILRIDRKMSWSEIADVFSEPDKPVTEVALRNRFQRLKSKLRKLAKSQGILPP